MVHDFQTDKFMGRFFFCFYKRHQNGPKFIEEKSFGPGHAVVSHTSGVCDMSEETERHDIKTHTLNFEFGLKFLLLLLLLKFVESFEVGNEGLGVVFNERNRRKDLHR